MLHAPSSTATPKQIRRWPTGQFQWSSTWERGTHTHIYIYYLHILYWLVVWNMTGLWLSILIGNVIVPTDELIFFPRASERRVLPIVGVCKASSHLHIFSSSHLLIFTSSHLHIFSSSHPHIFSSSLIFSSSHLLIFTPSHLHIFSSSHLLIFTSSHPHIFSSSSHLHIFSSSHLLIFTSSHLHIFSHLLIFTSSHIFSHLLIFTSSHIFSHLLTSSHIFSYLLTSSHIFSHLLTSSHIFSSSHLLISHLLLLPSCPLLLFYFSFEGGSKGSANETARNATLSHEMRVERQKLR